ncbi:hypothetical protein M9H77_12261 [Catharanthus roseus]|uniref:Uncharacterized protein n=1 Tax=Catharanthus roseus TaxID=4058 RepID=A0ACC0BH00_CATRO|nr:hypothetical protein M9H77_12261 [Catharanthus roseus]
MTLTKEKKGLGVNSKAEYFDLEPHPSSWCPWSLCGDFHAKFVENCDYESSFLYAFMQNFDRFILSIQLLSLVSHKFEFPHDEQNVLIVVGFLKALLLGNLHGFQFYHFHFKEFLWLLFCGKKMNGSFKDHDEKLVYPISFIDYLLKRDILKDFLVQNTTSCDKLLHQAFGGILLYSLTFKEFLDELISLLYCKEELGGLFPLEEMEYQMGKNMGQAIKDWLISNSAFDEKSLSGLTSFRESFIKELSTIASFFIVFAHNSTILYYSFEVDYGDNLLMSFDLTPFSIDHALSFGEVNKLEFDKYILFKDHDAIDAMLMTFEKKRLVCDFECWVRILGFGWCSF